MGTRKNAFFLQENPMPIKFLVLRVGGFGVLGGGSADFIFMGARLFLKKIAKFETSIFRQCFDSIFLLLWALPAPGNSFLTLQAGRTPQWGPKDRRLSASNCPTQADSLFLQVPLHTDAEAPVPEFSQRCGASSTSIAAVSDGEKNNCGSYDRSPHVPLRTRATSPTSVLNAVVSKPAWINQ